MKGCIVENNVVVNIINVPADQLSDFNAVDLGEYPQIGDTVVDGVITEMATREAQVKANAKREERDELLKETDIWALSDRTMTQAQIDYRQALRDLPAQDGFPDVDMPTLATE